METLKITTKSFLLLFLAYSLNGQQNLDKDFVIKYLQETKYALDKEIHGLSKDLWLYKPSPSEWSISEIVEHVAKAELSIYKKLNGNLIKENKKNGPLENAHEIDEHILHLTKNREKKLKAPAPIWPNGKWETPEEFSMFFRALRNRTIYYVQTSDADFRLYTDYFPPLGKDADAYHWLLIIAAHTERHIGQIKENKHSFGKLD